VIYQGDALTVLKTIKEESINCCITSPPYWALRDYGVEGQLGLEPTFQEYITKLCDTFDEVKRVLRKDGTCWVNMGDSFANSGGMSSMGGRLSEDGKTKDYQKPSNKCELPSKCLVQIPSRFSIEMCNRGWILRNVLIWHKPNCMPSSVKDRFTVDFEYIFFFVKSKKYWFERLYEPLITAPHKPGNKVMTGVLRHDNTEEDYARTWGSKQGRNKRCVWKITTKPFKEAHFAVFPEELIETPIKAGCPPNGTVLDPFCGSGTTGVVAKKLNRRFVGIELNKEYIKMAEKRIANTQGSLL